MPNPILDLKSLEFLQINDDRRQSLDDEAFEDEEVDVDDLPENLRNKTVAPLLSSSVPVKEVTPPAAPTVPQNDPAPLMDPIQSAWGDPVAPPSDPSQSVAHDLVSKLIEDDEPAPVEPVQPQTGNNDLSTGQQVKSEIPSVQQIQWFYLDPKGNEQGPFSSR